MSTQARSAPRTSRRASLLLTGIVALAAVLPAIVAAATTNDVRTLTEGSWSQTCSSQPNDVLCTGPTSRVHAWTARISPISGSVSDLFTGSVLFLGPPLDGESINWMTDLHSLVCGAPKAIAAFVNQVAALKAGAGTGQQQIGACRISGDHVINTQGRSWFRINANVPPPPTPGPATPTPTAAPRTPTPTSTPVPTAKPTPGPTPKPSAKPSTPPGPAPTPTAAAAATPGVGPPPSPSTSPSATPSPDPSGFATIAPVATAAPPAPSPVVGGETTAVPSPAPSVDPASGGGGASPEPSRPTWEGSVLGIQDVNPDGGAVGGSLLLALLLLLMIGFIAELFNNTVESNSDVIAGWFGKGPIDRVRGALGRIRIDLPGRPGVLGFIALTALISSFVDPGFGLNLRSIAVFLGFLIGLIVVLASFKLPPILARRRRTGELGQLRPLPWALVIAALFVLASRLLQLQPGYLYGIVLGAIFVTDVSDREEGRDTFLGSLWTLGAAILAWVALTWLRGLGLPEDGFGVTLLSTAFAATLVAGLEAAAFALMPLRFLPGYVIYRWNRLAWATLWGVSLFAFLHILIGPMAGYVSELSPEAFLAALGVFAAFGALSIGTWLYFRLRHPPATESLEAG